MTPAEFDTRRRLLGLSVQETGHVCALDGEPVSEKSIRKWCAGGQTVPGDAIDALMALEDRLGEMVDRVVSTMTERTIAGPVRLRRYRDQAELDESLDANDIPIGAHAIYVGWLADALAAEGVASEIVWAAGCAGPY